ncbi:MAG: tRNA lysidine(34) synthetase TilS [Burkholderiales bacterium PBB3]|nr:MAG: tRNA lysidine(34) synthetase TilS [Burkholderiales bacterium PBB3]
MTQSFAAALQDFSPPLPLAVALSGGADSTALLVACAEKWPGQVEAWHINHGLQAAAVDFESHCERLCASLQVPLQVLRVDASAASGQSPEDAARAARYNAFDALARMDTAGAATKSVAIAQHANDQVETLLLALSRGAGLAGLSGMPAHWQRDGLQFYRPLLCVAGQHIRDWLLQRGIPFCEDPTNSDVRYTRNRIRAQVMPALQAAFPQMLDTFARSASHAAQGQALLNDLASEDWLLVARDDGLPKIKALQQLCQQHGSARQANVLRHWLKHAWHVIPSTAQLGELQSQVQACTTRGHRIHIKVGHGFVQSRGPVLTWYNP